MSAVPYALDELGWLQFQQLCDRVLELEAGVDPGAWSGEADWRRRVELEHGLALPSLQLSVPGAVSVQAVWEAADPRMVIASGPDVHHEVVAAVLGRDELAQVIEARADLRLRMPSLLGIRPLDGLVADELAARSTLDPAQAHALARVYVPTGAYGRAIAVLARHRFAVLTGPPEMGKTAAATMVALARLSAGWEAHECRAPDDLLKALAPGRPQVFVADDAFGSTEYRPEAAERWARDLPRVLDLLDDRHWLIWTSRPAPLRAGLHRVHQERGAERFPRPGEVQVDASALTVAEKALIFLRHVRAADVPASTRRIGRRVGPAIVAHPHFTPERIRRFAATRLADLPRAGPGRGAALEIAEQELAQPTDAMAASLRALPPEYRALLVAMLDQPDGPVPERDLVAVLHRHQEAELAHRPADLIDRVTDHFLKVLP